MLTLLLRLHTASSSGLLVSTFPFGGCYEKKTMSISLKPLAVQRGTFGAGALRYAFFSLFATAGAEVAKAARGDVGDRLVVAAAAAAGKVDDDLLFCKAFHQ